MVEEIDTDALHDIKGMTPKIMKLLIEEGFATPHQIAMASPDTLSRIQGITDNKARQIIYAARESLGMCEFVHFLASGQNISIAITCRIG
jgi:transcription termination factor NusA